MVARFLFFFMLLASLPTFAKTTILITDVDDTLKESHIRSRAWGLENAFETDEPFQGMVQLVHEIASQGHRVFYVSMAPEKLMLRFHRQFLQIFPMGELFLAPWRGRHGFKFQKINNLIQNFDPDQVILMGDTTESDPVIYREVVRHNPKIQFLTFIRWNNTPDRGKELDPSQIPFVSAAEVAARLWQKQILNPRSVQRVLDQSLPLELPDWVDCRGYSAISTNPRSQSWSELRSEIRHRCHE